MLPRIEIFLSRIRDNARILSDLYSQKGIAIMGVTKAVLGHPLIAEAMIQGGVKFIADSRIENIQVMRKAGVKTRFVLLRTALSQAESIVRNVDISLNTEIEIIRELSYFASRQNKIHQIIIMVEMGDLREGILPDNLFQFVHQVTSFPNIQIVGIGCNLACYGGIKPNNNNMNQLSKIAIDLENEFALHLEIISGGNSANYQWFKSTQNVGRINNLRLGESILLGCETIDRKVIAGLHTDNFQLIAEIIESKDKPSLPYGQIGQNAFGKIPVFQDRGIRRRMIIALGRQDVLATSLRPITPVTILGASSDHMVLDSNNSKLKVGSEVKFNLDYGGLLSVMTSPFIQKKLISSLITLNPVHQKIIKLNF
jgi:predicted amino acid racemase